MQNYSQTGTWVQSQQPLINDTEFRNAANQLITSTLNTISNQTELGGVLYNKARNNPQFLQGILVLTTFFVEFGLAQQPGMDRKQLLSMCAKDVIDIHAIQELKQPGQENLQYRIPQEYYKYLASRANTLQGKLNAVVQRNNLQMTVNLQLYGAPATNQYHGQVIPNNQPNPNMVWDNNNTTNNDGWWGGANNTESQRVKSVSDMYFDNLTTQAGMDSPAPRGGTVKPSVLDSLFETSTKVLSERSTPRKAADTIPSQASAQTPAWEWSQPNSDINHGVVEEFSSVAVAQDMEATPYQPHVETQESMWDWSMDMHDDDDSFDTTVAQPVPQEVINRATQMQNTAPVASTAQKNQHGDIHVKDGWCIANPDTWNDVFAKAPRNPEQPYNLTLPLRGTRLYRQDKDGRIEQRLLDIPMDRFKHNPAELLGTAHTAEEFDEPVALTQAIKLSDTMLKAEGDKPKRLNAELIKESTQVDKIQTLVDDQKLTGFSDAELMIRALARSRKASEEIKQQNSKGVNIEYVMEKADILHLPVDADDFLHKLSFMTHGDTEEFKTYLDFFLRFVECRDAIHHDVFQKLDKHLVKVVNDYLSYDLGYEGKLALEDSFAEEFGELVAWLDKKDPDSLRTFHSNKEELLRRSRIVANAAEADRLRKLFLSRVGKAEYEASVEIMARAVFIVENQQVIRTGLSSSDLGIDEIAAPGNQVIMKQSAYPNTLRMLNQSLATAQDTLGKDKHFTTRLITADGYSFDLHESALTDDVLILARRK